MKRIPTEDDWYHPQVSWLGCLYILFKILAFLVLIIGANFAAAYVKITLDHHEKWFINHRERITKLEKQLNDRTTNLQHRK